LIKSPYFREQNSFQPALAWLLLEPPDRIIVMTAIALQKTRKTNNYRSMIKSILGLTATTLTFGALVASADPLPTGPGFGTIPGTTASLNNGNPYSGTSVSYASSAYDVIDVGQGNQLTIALSTTGRGASAPTPISTGANGAGTFHVAPGFTTTSGVNYALWDVDFWVSVATGSLASYNFTLTATDLATGNIISANPLLIGDNVGTPQGAGNSENLNFSFLFGASFDPSINDTIDFVLTAKDANLRTIGTVTDTTVVGTGVPDTTSTAGILAAGVAGLFFAQKKLAKKQTV
jgi:hypothetical protein